MKTTTKRLALGISLFAGALAATQVLASDDKFAAYRDALAGDNPGEFWIDDGKKLFFEKRGPKKASLEQCDFGLGPGVLKDSNVRGQWRRNERCVLAMRLPWLKTGSEIDAALTLYMLNFASQSAEKIQVPGIKPRA